jgi:endonuclease/exonuclease/phosphatase family metal-dependent hydrolase
MPDGPSAPAPDTGERIAGAGVRVRVMSANLTTGNLQAYEDPGIRILQGAAPDVVLLQEFNYKTDSDADLRAFVDRAFGPEFVYFREAGDQIPNGIISRYPIVEAGEWDDPAVANRDFAWARIDVPGPIDLYAISVHLLSSTAAKRQTEAQTLAARIAALPAGAYVVLGGDFNTSSRAEACVIALAPVLVTSAPYPVDVAGNPNTNAARAKPYDWVLANPALAATEGPVDVGAHSFPAGWVIDTRTYAPIADLAPAQAGDSGATNMQHMGVVRDFFVEDDAPASLAVSAPNGGERFVSGTTQTIAWTSSRVTDVKVELSVDGTTFVTLAPSVPADAGTFAFVMPQVTAATTAARVRVSATPGGTPSDASDAPFAIVPPATPARAFVNEILANEPGSAVAGEFVEIVNAGDQAIDLSGWTLADATAVRHVFASGTTLAGHRAIVVFGGASAIPAGLTNAVAASSGTLSLNNSTDTVTLANAAGTVDRFAYPSTLSGGDGVSMNRSPDGDPAGTFVLHTHLAATSSSPGTRANGAAF